MILSAYCSKEKWEGSVYKEAGITVIESKGSGIWGDKINEKITFKKNLSLGVEEGQACLMFYGDLSIAIDDELNIYILDIKNYRLLKFDKLGNFIWETGRKGQGPGEFQSPSKVAIGSFKEVCVLDNFNLIHYFNAQGRHLKTINLRGYFRDLQFLPDGRLFLNKSISRQLGIAADFYSTDGKFLEKFPDEYLYGPQLSIGGRGHLGGELRNLGSRIYMVLPDKYEIREYDLKGKLQKKIKRDIKLKPPEIKVTKSGFFIGTRNHLGPCFLYDGRILINQLVLIEGESEKDLEIQVLLDFFNEKGQFLGSYKLPELAFPLTIDSENNIYFVKEDPFPRIIRSILEIK